MATADVVAADPASSKKSSKTKKTKLRESATKPAPPSPQSSSDAEEEEREKKTKKRKRDIAPEDELEIDITAPEPLSKKALRLLKKGKTVPTTNTAAKSENDSDNDDENNTAAAAAPDNKDGTSQASKQRSVHGIWIGNLPFSATKASLRSLFTDNSTITDAQITRIHMPAPTGAAAQPRAGIKPTNKGFAYVDFSDASCVDAAIALSESPMGGRRVLIKNAKSFEGRPAEHAAKAKEDAATNAGLGDKPPSKRVFVGNLSFDVTKEDLEKHFAQCGEIEHIHIATFEDSGKCKGFAWVTFADIDAATSAVRGWILRAPQGVASDDEESESGGESEDEDSGPARKKKSKKQPKPRKWFVNKLYGRALRAEFAEDASVRYKKRFGSKTEGDSNETNRTGAYSHDASADSTSNGAAGDWPARPPRRGGFNQRPGGGGGKRFDARTIKPGAALSGAQRGSAAIIQGQGKKITFD